MILFLESEYEAYFGNKSIVRRDLNNPTSFFKFCCALEKRFSKTR
jgi:hypothetical protein